MKRKIFIGVLVAVLVLAIVGLVSCDNGEIPSNNGGDSTPPNYTPPEYTQNETLTFELNDAADGYVVTGLAEGVTETNVTVPGIYNGLPVTVIGESAFAACSHLTVCRIPDSVEVIKESAFQNCSGLRLLRFDTASKLTQIAANAFQNCTGLTAVTLPDSVVSVGDRAFQGCTALKSVALGNGVETVGVEAFRGCSKLATVNVGNSLKQLGQSAFLNCSLIEQLTLPNTLESVGLGALQGCTGIKNISLPFVGAAKYVNPIEDERESVEKHTNFGYIFGANSFDDQHALNLDNLETVTITGSSPIGYHAFQNIGRYIGSSESKGVGLNAIIITGNVKVIGTGAFQGCFNLQTLVIPASVATIGRQILDVGVIKHVFYCGTQTDWNKLGTNSSNNMGLYANSEQSDPKYFYSESQPTAAGQYWHYVDGVHTPWN